MYALFYTIPPLLLSFIILSLFTFPFFFFTDTATTEIYTLSLHDALPISPDAIVQPRRVAAPGVGWVVVVAEEILVDRKSTRLNSSHRTISYAVFCLKKKKKKIKKL